MCEPTTILTLGSIGAGALQAGAAILEHGAQQDAFDKNRQATNDAYKDTQEALGARKLQEMAAAGSNIYQLQRESQRARALAAVSAGESGVAGASLDALEAVLDADAFSAQSDVEANLSASMGQLEREKKAARATRDSRLASVPEPSWALTGLRIGRAALDTATTVKRGVKV